MVNLMQKVGHAVKQSPKTIKNAFIISNVKRQTNFRTITVNKNRNPKLIVSLTSYKKRFPTLALCLKSLLKQTLLPDRMVLYLSNNEKEEDLPSAVKDLQKYGLEIKFVDLDLKPHKKYYYAMKEFPDDIVITVDDDMIYSKNLVKELYRMHLEYPNCVVAGRAHEIIFNNNNFEMYKKWIFSSSMVGIPSMKLLATGVGGVLYPPHILNTKLLFDLTSIKKYLTVDDLWLKTVEVISNVPVVICNQQIEKHRIEIPNTEKVGLFNLNLTENKNDLNLKELQKDYKLAKRILNSKC